MQHPGERLRRFRCEARYDQQMWEIDVELGDRSSFVDAGDVAWLQDRFDAEHLDLFAVNQPRSPIEVITWVGEARVVRRKPALTAGGDGPAAAAPPAPSRHRQAFFDDVSVDTPVFGEDALRGQGTIQGPAILEEPTTTIVVPPGSSVTIRDSHYLVHVA